MVKPVGAANVGTINCGISGIEQVSIYGEEGAIVLGVQVLISVLEMPVTTTVH